MNVSEDEFKIYNVVRGSVAAAIVEGYSLMRFKGEDHLQFLQGQTTNDIKSLKDGQGQKIAILDPKAKVRTIAVLYRCRDCVYMLLPTQTAIAVFDHLSKYIVMDDVDIEQLSYEFLVISGPDAKSYIEGRLSTEISPEELYDHQQVEWQGGILPFALNDFFGEKSFIFFVKSAQDFYEELTSADIPLISPKIQELLRLESGTPLMGIDIKESTLFPETGLQTECVSYTKGCFVGQEIVARVKYRGSVNKALMGIEFDDASPQEVGDFTVRGQRAGVITSLGYSPHLGKDIALAYINKRFRAPGTRMNLEMGEVSYKATVTLLPFYIRASEQEEADALYHKAIEIFSGSNENDQEAESLFRKAILKNPKMADAYEALGVILSRNERYDEAIELMKQLKEINPEEVMAYSNLSLFYMKKGMIPEAEEEKAAATAAGFKKAAKERKIRIDHEKVEQQKATDAAQRVGMFQQVLEIDEGDLIANFGMGKALVESGRPADAIKYLKKCLDVKKDYSAAYLQLGIAYMKNRDQAQAVETFEIGIECANNSGDLMPKNEMERYLSDLRESKG